MIQKQLHDKLTPEILRNLMPSSRSDEFFEALYGDAAEGAFDISIVYKGYSAEEHKLTFELELRERPGKCLACNLTYGLPQVLKVHPVINLKGFVENLNRIVGDLGVCSSWSLAKTRPINNSLHTIPLVVTFEPA